MQVNGSYLRVEISSDGFVEEVGQDTLISVNFIDAFHSFQNEANGWNAIIRRGLSYSAISRSPGGTAVMLTIPPSPAYDVLVPETIGIYLPASVLLSGQSVLLDQTIGVVATAGTATASGSLALQGGGNTVDQPCCNREDYLTSAGGIARTLIITLTDDHFVDGIEYGVGGVFSDLLAAIRSEQQEGAGWNSIVQQALSPSHVALSSTLASRDTIMLTIPVTAEYATFAPETIVVAVPPSAVKSQNTIVATPRLLIRATPGALSINGTLFDSHVESSLQNAGSTLLVTATGDSWSDAFKDAESEQGRDAARKLIQGFSSGIGNVSSWNREVTPLALSFNESIVSIVGNETVMIAMPRIPLYDILLPESIDVLIDFSLVKSNTTLSLLSAFQIVSNLTPPHAAAATASLPPLRSY